MGIKQRAEFLKILCRRPTEIPNAGTTDTERERYVENLFRQRAKAKAARGTFGVVVGVAEASPIAAQAQKEAARFWLSKIVSQIRRRGNKAILKVQKATAEGLRRDDERG